MSLPTDTSSAVNIFISYCHRDSEYLKDESLLGFLQGLEQDNVRLWTDHELVSGDAWDAEIRARLEAADIALVLVSQAFLDSPYCTDVEVSAFLKKAQDAGLIIFPIILSPCEWERHPWLKSRQFLPGRNRTIEEDFTDPGDRKRLFLEIRQELRQHIQRLRGQPTAKTATKKETTDSFERFERAPSRSFGRQFLAFAAALVVVLTALFLTRTFSRSERLVIATDGPPVVTLLAWGDVEEASAADWRSLALRDLVSFELETRGLRLAAPVRTGAGSPVGADAESAQRIAQETGADVLIWVRSNRTQEEPGIVQARLELRATATDQRLDLTAESAARQEVPALVARLGDRIIEALDIDLQSSSAVPSMLEVTSAASPSGPSELAARGVQALRLLDTVTAREFLTRVLELEPTDPLVLSAMADALWDLGDEEGSLEQVTLALESSEGLERRERFLLVARAFEARRQLKQSSAILSLLWPAAEWQTKGRDEEAVWLDQGLHLALLQARARWSQEAFDTLEIVRQRRATAEDPRIDLFEAEAAKRLPDFERQREAAMRAAEQAQRQDAPFLIARAHHLEGEAFEQLGDLEAAKVSYRKARQLYARERHLQGQAHAHNSLGNVLWAQRDLAGAKVSYDQASRLYLSVQNRRMQTKMQVNKACVLRDQGELDAAIVIFEQAVEQIRPTGDREAESRILLNLGDTQERRGHLSEALKSYKSALEIEQELGGEREEAKLLATLGPILERRGELGEARRAFEEAVEKSRRSGNELLESEALVGLASVLYHQGDLAGAKRTYSDVLPMFEENGNVMAHADALRGLGDVLRAQGELDEAAGHHLRALESQQKVVNWENVGKTRGSLALTLLAQGKLEAAEARAREAVEDFEHGGARLKEAWARSILARALLARGELGQAHGQIQDARRLLEGVESSFYQLPIDLAAVRIRAARGEALEARADLQSLLAVATAEGFVEYDLEARLVLGEIDVDLGKRRAGISRLTEVEQEALEGGFDLIGRKAEQAQIGSLGREPPEEGA